MKKILMVAVMLAATGFASEAMAQSVQDGKKAVKTKTVQVTKAVKNAADCQQKCCEKVDGATSATQCHAHDKAKATVKKTAVKADKAAKKVAVNVDKAAVKVEKKVK